ncbi:MAG: hypothetical protein WCP97_08100 [bacterium]
MQPTIFIYKPVGLTPLQAVERFRKQNPEYKDVKIGYAGRLDPMARGLLLLLIGDEAKQRTKYERLPKSYTFDVVFGIETDTYDILGKLKQHQLSNLDETSECNIIAIASEMVGKHQQPYPPFSAGRVKGKPLFYWAREGKLDEITIPEKAIEIYSLEVASHYELSMKAFETIVKRRIRKVSGEFRQKEILAEWERFFQVNPQQKVVVFRFRTDVSSGTYVRSLAHEMGKKVGGGGICLDIFRTRVGESGIVKNLTVKKEVGNAKLM